MKIRPFVVLSTYKKLMNRHVEFQLRAFEEIEKLKEKNDTLETRNRHYKENQERFQPEWKIKEMLEKEYEEKYASLEQKALTMEKECLEWKERYSNAILSLAAVNLEGSK